jgi:cytochrome c-type biogenesis protein
MTFSFPVLFAAGVVSFASPCVLPMMPLYLGTLASGNVGPEASTRRTLAVAVAFAAGLSTVFVALGAFAGPLGAALVGHRPWFLGASGLLLLFFGLRSLGVLHFATLDQDARPLLTRVKLGGGIVAAYVFGAAFALGWSPCIGPVLASVLTFAAADTHSAGESAGYLAIYAAGFSTPLLLLAALASRATKLVRSVGRYTPIVERVTGAAMVLGAIVALYGSYEGWAATRGPAAATVDAGASRASSTAIAAASAETSCAEATGPGTVCGFQADEGAPAAASAPVPKGRRVVEIMARHCPACEPVLAEVDAACARTGAAVTPVDVGTPSGRALATRFAVRGTPTFLFLDDDGHEMARLIGETDARRFVDTVEGAYGLTCRLETGGGSGAPN